MDGPAGTDSPRRRYAAGLPCPRRRRHRMGRGLRPGRFSGRAWALSLTRKARRAALYGRSLTEWRWQSSHESSRLVRCSMVTITFSDRATEKRALAFLLGRFSGRVLRSGEHIVPEAALEALADQDIPFSVIGRTTYEQQMAAIRGPAATSVQ